MHADVNKTPELEVLTTSREEGSSSASDEKISLAHANTPLPRSRRNRSGIALSILTTIAIVFTLKLAQDFFIPLVFGILISYTLNPIVVALERIKLPRVIGVTLVLLGLFAVSVVVATTVYKQAQSIANETPMAVYKLKQALKPANDGTLGTLDLLRNTRDALKQAASAATGTEEETADDTNAKTEKLPEFNLTNWLWAGSLSVISFIGQLLMVLFLVFFALLSGDTFKRKLVKLTGPTLTNKKITVHILDDINKSIQRYMFMLLVTNSCLAIITGLALQMIGLDNSGAWALAAGLLHIVPYFGPLISATVTAFAAFLQFESFSMMFLVFGVLLAISTMVGMFMTTWMTGRIAKMNATAVFIALLFGGWLWGVWGMLLCIPLIVVIKVVSERIEGMQLIAELLGE